MKKGLLAFSVILLVIVCCSVAGCTSQNVVPSTSDNTPAQSSHDPLYGSWYFISDDGSEFDIYFWDADMTGDIYIGYGEGIFWDDHYKFYWEFDKAVDKIRYYSLEIDGTTSASVKYNGNDDTVQFYLKNKPGEIMPLTRMT